MKKTVLMLVAVALLAALGACALAAGWTEYVNRDGAKVYADYDTDSKVIATLNKGDKVTGVMNSLAAGVITTCTSAPFFTKRRKR